MASCALLGLAGIFLTGSFVSLGLDRNDTEFRRADFSILVQPEAWLQEGNRKYYVDLDADDATRLYRKAILANPLLIRAWLALAESEMVAGREGEGRQVLETLAPFLDRVSTWKWQELLLAYEIRDEAYFNRCFNFVLQRLPHRVHEACYLAGNLWNGWAGAQARVSAENREVFLKELIRAKEVETALSLWAELVAQAGGPSQDLQLRFGEFLLSQKRLREAKDVWKGYLGGKECGVHDGGFEEKPLGQAFGWRVSRQHDVTVERSLEAPYEGSYSMHVRFNGSRNVSFNGVYQIIPVEAERAYSLSFAQKSRSLTTDQGVAVEVGGYGCKGLNQRSAPVLGTSPWRKEELLFSTPEGCDAAVIRIVRKESLKLDNKISGDFWLDSVSLKPVQ
jgi:hypothetical protein